MNEPNNATNHKLVTRWGKHDALFSGREGWLGVPDAFLRCYGRLKPYGLTTAEAMFVLQLMTYKWTEEAPFPSYKTLARRMGVTSKMAQRYAQKLESKGYLQRCARIGSSNRFEMQSLFDAVNQAVRDEAAANVAPESIAA